MKACEGLARGFDGNFPQLMKPGTRSIGSTGFRGTIQAEKDRRIHDASAPVSYTHLDVYKRQTYNIDKMAQDVKLSRKGGDIIYIIFYYSLILY